MSAAEKDHWTLRIPKPKRIKAFLFRHSDILIAGMLVSIALIGISVFYIFTIYYLEQYDVADAILNITPRHLVTVVALAAGLVAIKKTTGVFP